MLKEGHSSSILLAGCYFCTHAQHYGILYDSAENVLTCVCRQRFDFLKHVRNLAEDSWENTDAESVASEDSMDVSISGDKVHIRRPGKYYRNQVNFQKRIKLRGCMAMGFMVNCMR